MSEYKFYIICNTVRSGGEYYAGESGPYGTRNPTYLDTTFDRVFANQPPQMFYDTIEVSEKEYVRLSSNKELYLSVIFYTDGDTFGSTHGLHQLVGLSVSEKEAEKKNKTALSGDVIGYKPWEGYFSSLIGAEIFKLPLV